MSKRSVFGALALLLLSALPARAQTAVGDSLGALLSTPDLYTRADVVYQLSRQPLSGLSPSTRTGIIQLLTLESAGTPPGRAQAGSDSTEVWGEYIATLTSLVVKLNDPTSYGGLANLGIQTSPAAEGVLASGGHAAVTALDVAWTASPATRYNILRVWGQMLAATTTPALSATDRQHVQHMLFAAVDSEAQPLALAASSKKLTAFGPVFAGLASSQSDPDDAALFVKVAAELNAQRAQMSSTALIDEAIGYVTGFCMLNPTTGVTLPGIVQTALRITTCTTIYTELKTARSSLALGVTLAAKITLDLAATGADGARVSGVFTPGEGYLVSGAARFVSARY